MFPHHDDPKVLANSFNKFYLQKVEQLRSKIPISNQKSQRNSNFRGTIMDCFRQTTVQELRKILKESGIKTSFNDALPASILKQVMEELLPHLCQLFNKSLSTGSPPVVRGQGAGSAGPRFRPGDLAVCRALEAVRTTRGVGRTSLTVEGPLCIVNLRFFLER